MSNETRIEEETPPKLRRLQEKLWCNEQITLEDLSGVLYREGMQSVSIEEMDEAIATYLASEYPYVGA